MAQLTPKQGQPPTVQHRVTLDTCYSSLQWFKDFPRADMCMYCRRGGHEHANGKCLFGSTSYHPVQFNEWHNAYNRYVQGHDVENVIAAIAFHSTGGNITE